MKLEIEITDAEIRSAIERKIRVAIADQNTSYGNEQMIKETIKRLWKESVENEIRQQLNNNDAIRESVRAAIENRIKAQLLAVIRKGEK